MPSDISVHACISRRGSSPCSAATEKEQRLTAGRSSRQRMADSIGSVWRPKANPWLIAIVVALAAFMEVLDTSIANVALPYIAGNVGASGDESTWVLTSYLVSNAIVLPLTGWIAGRFGRKRFF